MAVEGKILCPVHKQPLKIEPNKLVVNGYCVCDVPRNKHKNRKVYQKNNTSGVVPKTITESKKE